MSAFAKTSTSFPRRRAAEFIDLTASFAYIHSQLRSLHCMHPDLHFLFYRSLSFRDGSKKSTWRCAPSHCGADWRRAKVRKQHLIIRFAKWRHLFSRRHRVLVCHGVKSTFVSTASLILSSMKILGQGATAKVC